jgi:tetratricopeptide (TPR) repeat protein
VPRAESYCNVADMELALEDIEAAVSAYTKALEVDPDSVRARSGRGYARAVATDYEGALEDLSRVLQHDPDLPRARRLRGIVYENLGRWDEALADYDAIIEDEPTAQALCDRAGVQQALGRLEEAEADYAQAIALDPEYADAYSGQARLYVSLGDHDAARAAYDAAINVDESDVAAYIGRGEAAAAMGESDQALWDYDRAIELDPRSAAAWRGRAAAHQAIAEGFRERMLSAKTVTSLQAALRDLDEAVELELDDPTLYAEKMIVLRSLGAYDDAVDTAKRGLTVAAISPESAVWLRGEEGEALRMWGTDMRSPERLSEALAAFGVAAELTADDCPSWLHELTGLTLLALDRHDDAIEQLEQAVVRDDTGWGGAGLGRARYLKGETALALASFDHVIELDDDPAASQLARVGRGLCLRALGSTEEAARSFDEAVGANPSAHDYVERGMLIRDFGLNELAETDFLHAIELDPDSARSLNVLAWHYSEAGDARLEHGLELANRAVRMASPDGDLYDALDTQGWILVQLDRPDEALEPLRRAYAFNRHAILTRNHLAEAEAAASNVPSASV